MAVFYSNFPVMLLTFAVISLSSITNCVAKVGNLTLLGEVDGKQFFVDFPSSENWYSARERCSDAGMRLPSITSVEQEQFLISSLTQSNFTIPFWTGACEIATPENFRWLGIKPAPEVLTFRSWETLDHCLVLQIDSSYQRLAIADAYQYFNVMCEHTV